MIEYVICNILDVSEGIIIYPLDTMSKYPRGMAFHLFNKYPNSNIYNTKYNLCLIPGKIIVTNNNPILIGFFMQIRYGSWNSYNNDSENNGQKYFGQCIEELKKHIIDNDITKNIYFKNYMDHFNWKEHMLLIEKFASSIKNKVIICTGY